MKIFIKKIAICYVLIISAVFVSPENLSAQGVVEIVNTPLSSNTNNIVKARDKVIIKNGGKFKPTSGSFLGKIDETIVGALDVTPNMPNSPRSQLNTSLEVGSLAISSSVSGTGQAVSSFPLIVPPGTANMQPQLSIQYSSQSEAGLLGYGWDIAGLSSISRTGSNMYYDGMTKSLEFGSGDNFVFDGQRLFVTSGIKGDDGSYYRTEAESYSQIIAHGNTSGGPAWFSVLTKSGLYFEFGNSSSSKVIGPNGVIVSWKVNLVRDPNGNYMVYSYKQDIDENVIERVDYTGNVQDGLLPYNSIQFFYDRRPDANTVWVNGMRVRRSLVMRQAKTFADGALAKTYEFSYGKDLYTKLIQIDEIGPSGESYNPTLISWGAEGLSGLPYSTTNNWPLVGQGDFDGDGKVDLILYNYLATSNQFYVQFAGNQSLVQVPFSYTGKFPTISVMDIEGNDDKDELYISKPMNASTVGFSAFSYNASSVSFTTISNQITTSSFSLSSGNTIETENFSLTKVMLNGNYNSYTVLVSRMKKDFSSADPFVQLSCPYSAGNGVLPSGITNVTSQTLRFMDVNANGKTDIIRLTKTGGTSPSTIIDIFEVSGSTGVYTSIYSSSTLLNVEDFVDFGDFNGDGNIDILTHASATSAPNPKAWKIAYFDGISYKSPAVVAPLESTMSGNISVIINDVDGDGKSDILCNPVGVVQSTSTRMHKMCSEIVLPAPSSSTNYVGLLNLIETNVIQVYQNAIDNNLPIVFDLDNDILDQMREFFAPGSPTSSFTMFKGGSDVVKSNAFVALKVFIISEHNKSNTSKQNWWDKFKSYIGMEKRVYNWASPSVVNENPNLIIYKSNGLDFESKNIVIPGFNSVQQSVTGDFNGDGLGDLYTNLYVDFSYKPTIQLFDPTLIHFVDKITDGMNNTTHFRYASITGYGVLCYTSFPSTSNPYGHFTAPWRVVKQMKTEDATGLNIAQSVEYMYFNAVYNKEGKGFLGFRTVGSLARGANKYGMLTVNEFALDLNYAFLYPLRTQIKMAKSSASVQEAMLNMVPLDPLSTVDYTFEHALSYTGNKYYNFRPASQTSTDHLTGIGVATYFSVYDNYGNVTNQVSTYSNSTINTNTLTTYGTVGSWCDNKPLEQTVTTHKDGLYASKATSYGYDAYGNMALITEFTGMPKSITQTYSYNIYGLPTQIITTTEGKSRTQKYIYDAKKRFVIAEINSLNQRVDKTFDSRYGTMLTFKDIDGKIITNVYNGLGRLLKTTDKRGIITEFTRAWESSTSSSSVFVEYSSTPNMPLSKVWIDNYARKIKSSATFNGATSYVSYEYDNIVFSNLKRESKPYVSSPSKYINYTYDDITNRLINTSDDGRSNTIDYGMAPSKVTTSTYINDPSDLSKNSIHKTTIGHDGLVLEKMDNGGTITYTYSPNGQPSFIDVAGSYITIEYDDYGRQKSLSDPDAGTTAYIYNGFGELAQQSNPDNNTITYEYDNASRPTKRTLNANNASIAEITNYSYVTSGNGINRVLSVSNANVTETFAYDGYGRTLSVTERIGGVNYITSYTYNSSGDNTSVTYPSGFGVSKEYDEFGRLSLIKRKDNSQTIWKANQYNNYEMLTQAIVGNGMKYNYAYDANNILTGVSMQNPSNVTIYNRAYQFDYNSGNLLWRKDLMKQISGTTNPFIEEFRYDKLNRLIEAKVNNVVQQSLTYANNGNITLKSGVSSSSWEYNLPQPHAVSAVNNLNPGVDVTSMHQTATYNTARRVTNITDGYTNDNLSFIYGPDDERRKTTYTQYGTVQKEIIYVGNYEKLTTPTTQKEYHYIYAPTGLVAILIKEGSAQTMYYTCTDYQGSINALVTESGTIAEEYNYDAWGKHRNPADWTYNSVPAPNLIYRGYTGHEHLPAFGLINMNARLYDPVLGRMLSPDSYVQSPDFTQSYNRYSYAWNNPTVYADPDGNFVVLPILIMAAAGMGAIQGMDAAVNKNVSGLKMAAYTLGGAAVGAAAGYVGYTVGAATAGAMGSAGAGLVTQGIAAGYSGGFSGAFISSTGNSWIQGAGFLNGVENGFRAGIIGGTIGGIIGGITNGIMTLNAGNGTATPSQYQYLSTSGKQSLLKIPTVELPPVVLYAKSLWEQFSYSWATFSSSWWGHFFMGDPAHPYIGGTAPIPSFAGRTNWIYGAFKTEAKWMSQLSQRGWTEKQITEAIEAGKKFNAINNINKANSASRFVHPTTGQSVVIDDVTRELLHVGGPGFMY
jgi:RHS repeat-associated protein